jgi:hypothetical protein
MFETISFPNLWLDNLQLQFIQKQLRLAKKTAVEWASFYREVVFDSMLSHKEKLGGVDVEVQNYESKIGRCKRHVGHYNLGIPILWLILKIEIFSRKNFWVWGCNP